MINWVFGKVVESSNQVLSTTSGSISGNSIAGAGGVTYGGGTTGSISTKHENFNRWSIFTDREDLVSVSHASDLPAVVGDIVAVASDDKFGNILVANLTDNVMVTFPVGWGDTVKKFIGFLGLGFLIAMEDSTRQFYPIWLLTAAYPAFAARKVFRSRALVKESKTTLDNLFEQHGDVILSSREKRKQAFRNM